jgi:uncharacterized protein (DUF302 family)
MALSDRGIISTRSNHSVPQTVERLKQILAQKGVALFAPVDHSGEAASVATALQWPFSDANSRLNPEFAKKIVLRKDGQAKRRI